MTGFLQVFNMNSGSVVPINAGTSIYDSTFGVVMPRRYFGQRDPGGSTYGTGNGLSGGGNFYTTLIDAVTESPTALQCIKTHQDYLYGEGLVHYGDLEVIDSVTGIKTTINRIFKDMCDYFPFTWGAALKVTEGGMIQVLDFSQVRYQLPDGYSFKYRGGKAKLKVEDEEKYRIDKAKYYPWFGRELALLFIIEVEDELVIGEDIFIETKKNSYDLFYPVPGYFAAIKAIMAEPAAMEWLDSGLQNGFSANSVMSVSGSPNEEIQVGTRSDGHPIYKTASKIIDERMSNEFSGSKGSRLMVVWDRQVDLKSVDSSLSGSDIITQIITTLQSSIASAFDVDPRLANIQIPGKLGGSGEELEQIRAIQRERIMPLRDIILDCLYAAMSKVFVNVSRQHLYTNLQAKHSEMYKLIGQPIKPERAKTAEEANELAQKYLTDQPEE